MPWVDKNTRAVILLWKRCRDRGALPEPGGLLDQPEYLMEMFDVIDSEIAKFRQRQEDEQLSQKRHQEMLRDLHARH